jgi:hypothetical protein
MNHADHFRELAAMWRGVDWPAYERYTAAADALDRVAALERELAEARKPCPCKVRDAAIDAAIDAAMGGK